jgi:hypothetical protein
MLRLADPDLLRAHRSQFDVEALRPTGLDPVATRRLAGLVDRPYEDLTAVEVPYALELVAAAGYPAPLFAYFLPAFLRRPPLRDRGAADRWVVGLVAARGTPGVEAWAPEIDETLVRLLAARPVRGGDDPVDLWLSERALDRFELRAARRLADTARSRPGVAADWVRASEGPFYARTALCLLQRSGDGAERRFLLWESAASDADARAWVEVMFHVHGEGWRPEPASLDRLLDDPARLEVAEAWIAHPEPDVAIGAAAVALLLAPRRARELRARVEGRLRALAAADQDRFVLVPSVARLLGASG